MLLVTSCVLSLIFLGSLPYWLPAAVVALRVRIFTLVNGEEGIAIPGKLVDAAHFKEVYSSPAASGRSRGAALSDLFWYWLAPGPEIHQEHIEAGERYEEVARATRHILAVPKKAAEKLATECVERVLAEAPIRDAKLVRLRDWMMPIWAEFYYAVVFGQRCPPDARALIIGNANDVVTALKCCGLRHMKTRHKLTRFLVEKIEADEVPHALPHCLSSTEQAFYLQGTFFNTAVVQMSEAMVHLLMAIAQHPEIQQRLIADLDDDHALDRVIAETFRVFPLFGISHRITTANITVNEHTIPKGSVLCFNHPEYHRAGFDEPERLNPDRWLSISPQESNYIPFGVAANRPCPALGLAPVTMRAVVRELLKRFSLFSSASHTRSVPNRGPCLVVPNTVQVSPLPQRTMLLFMRVRDRWEDVTRSILQLVLGTYMVWDARRLRLCQRYFEAQHSNGFACGAKPIARPADSAGGEKCPFAAHAPYRSSLKN